MTEQGEDRQRVGPKICEDQSPVKPRSADRRAFDGRLEGTVDVKIR